LGSISAEVGKYKRMVGALGDTGRRAERWGGWRLLTKSAKILDNINL
jgi:hypothetical protein